MAQEILENDQFDSSDCIYELLNRRADKVFSYSPKLRVWLVVGPVLTFALFIFIGAGGWPIIFIPLFFILGPVVIAFIDFVILLPRLTSFPGFDEILATPIRDHHIVGSLTAVANEKNKGHLLPILIIFWILFALGFLLSPSMWIIYLFVIAPVYLIWLLIRKVILSVGLMASLMPARIMSSGVVYYSFGFYVLVVLTVVVLFFYFLFQNILHNNNTFFGLLMTPIVFLVLLVLPAILSNENVKAVISKRRRGDWS